MSTPFGRSSKSIHSPLQPCPENRTDLKERKCKFDSEGCPQGKIPRISPFSAAVELSIELDQARKSVHDNLYRYGQCRRAAVNIIMSLAKAYQTRAETGGHAIALLDRFLHCKQCKVDLEDRVVLNGTDVASNIATSPMTNREAQSAAIACFLLATKMKETSAPCTQDLGPTAGLLWCSPEHISASEIEVLNITDWALHGCPGNRSQSYKHELGACPQLSIDRRPFS